MIPQDFVKIMSASLGEERAERVIASLDSAPEVSVRVNPFKMSLSALREYFGDIAGDPVPWAEGEAFYLKERVSFTLDPLFHAGAYYVQEASSMYVGALLEKIFERMGRRDSFRVLDLCAAPGGKTTQLLSHLMSVEKGNPRNNSLVANEVMASRVAVLAENVAKWGCGGATVTNSDPSHFKGESFDIMVVDAPCSGEGMFRKDEKARENWSLNNVSLCASRQKRILTDIWDSLVDGGHLIYSTCTFNRYEDEDIVEWICSSLGAKCIEMRHFYPGEDRGEGFFAALMVKQGGGEECISSRKGHKGSSRNLSGLKVFESQFPMADEALSVNLPEGKYPTVELDRDSALRFLARETLSFKEQPTGYLLLTYKGLGLGFVKNLGNRANNLHPMPRRILSLKR
ncbi:MAG: rRNA cytosine-C5-methyltransferase [Bacteroidales bacterium]|nr:rRNA cytosine-C5-methyltransferase [Candidatus Cacconaster merdequi]